MKNWTTFAEVVTEMKVATVYMGVSGTRTQVKVQPLTTEPRLCHSRSVVRYNVIAIAGLHKAVLDLLPWLSLADSSHQRIVLM